MNPLNSDRVFRPIITQVIGQLFLLFLTIPVIWACIGFVPMVIISVFNYFINFLFEKQGYAKNSVVRFLSVAATGAIYFYVARLWGVSIIYQVAVGLWPFVLMMSGYVIARKNGFKSATEWSEAFAHFNKVNTARKAQGRPQIPMRKDDTEDAYYEEPTLTIDVQPATGATQRIL